MDLPTLYSFMAANRYGVVSSSSPGGTPQSALVGIAVTPSLQIIFDTVSSSRKYLNLTALPACSLVIGWAGEQTLQYEGVATQPTGPRLESLLDLYFAVWPECRAHLTWPDIAWFVIEPRWIRFSDYDQRPPFIQELSLP